MLPLHLSPLFIPPHLHLPLPLQSPPIYHWLTLAVHQANAYLSSLQYHFSDGRGCLRVPVLQSQCCTLLFVTLVIAVILHLFVWLCDSFFLSVLRNPWGQHLSSLVKSHSAFCKGGNYPSFMDEKKKRFHLSSLPAQCHPQLRPLVYWGSGDKVCACYFVTANYYWPPSQQLNKADILGFCTLVGKKTNRNGWH